MSRVLMVLSAAILLAALGAPVAALAQAGCQPTITQPCVQKPADKRTDQSQTTGAQGDTGDPKDRAPRIKLNGNTDFKFGTGGIGIGTKF